MRHGGVRWHPNGIGEIGLGALIMERVKKIPGFEADYRKEWPDGIIVYSDGCNCVCRYEAVVKRLAELHAKIDSLEQENRKLHNGDAWLTNGNCDDVHDSGDTWGTFQ